MIFKSLLFKSLFYNRLFTGQEYGIWTDLCADVWVYFWGCVRACGFMCIREVHSRSPAVRSDLMSGQLSSIGILTFTVDSNTHRRAVADIKTQLGSHALNNATGKCITHTLNAHSPTSQYVKSSPKASVFAYVWVSIWACVKKKQRWCRDQWALSIRWMSFSKTHLFTVNVTNHHTLLL